MTPVFHLLRQSLIGQECWLCRGFSRGAMLCGFCRRAFRRWPANQDRAVLAKEMGLDALALRYQFLFPLDVLVKRYKYQGELILAGSLAALLPKASCCSVPRAQASFGKPILIPVPTSPARIKQRGFDHLHLIARSYAHQHQLPLGYAQRKQESVAQARLGRRDRQRNLKDVFEISSNIKGRAVLLLDDVITTGATLSAMAGKCREQGAAWVGAVVLARTPGPGELPAS